MEDLMMPGIDDVFMMYDDLRDRIRQGEEEDLPNESFECFSEDPLTFEEMTAGMREDLEEVYAMTAAISRYSKDYPVLCRRLEQMIKRLGSCCVTKAVLEQKGFEFPSLQDLNIRDLYCLVSFNFRKIRTAYHDSIKKKNCADPGLLELECRWVDLADRLKATEEKIRLIRSGKINTDRMLERASMFKDDSGIRRKQRNGQGAFSERGRSLPVIGSVARQMIAEKKAEEAARKAALKNDPALKPLPGARPFSFPIFRPSKEIQDMIRLDDELEAQRKRAGQIRPMDVIVSGMPNRSEEAPARNQASGETPHLTPEMKKRLRKKKARERMKNKPCRA